MLVDVSDGDQIALHDDRPQEWLASDPVVLLLHGLAGCHGSGYMMRLADRLTRRGLRVFRMDMRGTGAALYWWRRSLFEQDDGEIVVELFDAPDAWDMETVPLNVRFVLRAILQLDLALPRDIAECLELPEASIEEALYYATARGYTERVGPRYTISWQWYRCIVTALRRQQLITG